MAKNYEPFGDDIKPDNMAADVLLMCMGGMLKKAEAANWTDLYFTASYDDGIALFGVKPPNKEEIEKAREKRRKQYERLKKEFEG
jgi:hypothetical protein